MNGEQAFARPIGWWLKEADAQVNAAFDAALHGTGVDRRSWQVLASLADGPLARKDVLTSLKSFDPPAVIEQVVERLRAQELVEESAGELRLTPAGAQQQESLARLVDGVRQRISSVLPPDDYVALVGLLNRLVVALR